MNKSLTGILLLLSGTVSAAETLRQDLDTQLASCQQQAVSTLDNRQCYEAANKAWDSELNKQYRLLLAGQSPAAQSALKNAQRAWVSYRDSYFRGMNSFYQQQEGTIWGLVAAEAKLNVIKDKARDLYRLRTSTDMGG